MPRALPPERELPSEILVVAGRDAPLASLEQALSRSGWSPHRVYDQSEAVDALTPRRAPSLSAVVAHHSAVPAIGAATLLDDLAATDPGLPFVFVTAQAHRSLTLELLRRGAFCVIPEPADTVTLLALAHAAGRFRQTAFECTRLRTESAEHARLAMLGRLAADVVHELSNPLDGVRRFLGLALDSLPREALERPYLEEALRGMSRMQDIVRDLLEAARRPDSRDAVQGAADGAVDGAVAGTVDGRERIEDAGRMIREAATHVLGDQPASSRGHPIELFVDVPRRGVLIPRALFQVLVNVTKNAADAMPHGGAIQITLREGRDTVVLTIADTGIGIPVAVQARVREPFFTTKDVGQGTGLGLPLCERIVEQLGGALHLSSTEGCGTTVRLTLPRATPRMARR